ncbi:TPA: EpsG family protein [Klebsiella pneumoniae]|nr:EpsG family protein [Klebsiella pneumoniae]
MRVNKLLPVSMVFSFLVPIVGLIMSFLSLDKKSMNRIPFMLVSLFYFFILIKTPPLGDLYRRYLEISEYNRNTNILEIITQHPDVLLYIHGYIFQYFNIPFFFIPAMYGAVMTYFYMASFRNMLLNNEYSSEESTKDKGFVFTHVIVFSALNILNLVLGIRYGAAMVFIIYAITCFYSRSKARFAVFSCLSLLMHFSMIFILICFLGSRYIKIKKNYIIPLVFIFYFLSSFVLRSVLPGISFMGVGDYAMGGYVDGVWSEIPTDTNTLILAYLSRGLGILALFFYLKDKNEMLVIDRFLNFVIPACFIMSISYTALNRYINIAQAFLMLRVCYMYLSNANIYSHLRVISNKTLSLLRYYLLAFAVLSMVIINVYTQRRTLIMGGGWVYAYTSPVFLLNYSTTDFKLYLKDIDNDGYWMSE